MIRGGSAVRYRLLGPSGLRVSEAALGTMTFGEDWGWGAAESECAAMFEAFAEAGGTFVDTANNYTDGSSERIVGQLVLPERERFVVATKYTLTTRPADPNAGGNHRKNLVQALDASLVRLGLEYVDLLWLHMWDSTTPVEEVMRALDDQVRAGKVLHVGASDTPAWVVSRANAVAEARGWTPFTAIQCEYALSDRAAERDLIPMARELGLGITAWGVVQGGVLTGKYASADGGPRRYESIGPRGQASGRTMRDVAAGLGMPPAQLAIAWAKRQGVIPILGARTAAQLRENLAALAVELPEEAVTQLDEAFPVDLGFPHDFLASDHVRGLIFGESFALIDR
jgi:aryl-alcohol dehydrogenase-like predicted oxidoreductase